MVEENKYDRVLGTGSECTNDLHHGDLPLAVEHAKLNAGGSNDSSLAAYVNYSVRTVKVETAIADFPLAVICSKK